MTVVNSGDRRATGDDQQSSSRHGSAVFVAVADYAVDLTKCIGRGTFADVFRGEDMKTRAPATENKTDTETAGGSAVRPRSVAVKRFKITSQHHKDVLIKEIGIMRAYQHRNLVRFYEMAPGQNAHDSSHVYVVLEFCGGGDLHRLIHTRRRRRLSEPLCRRLVSDLTEGLRFLHEKRLVHRDIKPQNLLLSSPLPLEYTMGDDSPREGMPAHRENDAATETPQDAHFVLKIADFGLARGLDGTSLAETYCGTPLYMAPEVLRRESYDARVDLWSAGAVLYEMVSGQPPFPEARTEHQLLRMIESSSSPIPLPSSSSGGIIVDPPIVVGDECRNLLDILLVNDPRWRATHDEFFAVSERFVTPAPVQPVAEGDVEGEEPVISEPSSSSDLSVHESDVDAFESVSRSDFLQSPTPTPMPMAEEPTQANDDNRDEHSGTAAEHEDVASKPSTSSSLASFAAHGSDVDTFHPISRGDCMPPPPSTSSSSSPQIILVATADRGNRSVDAVAVSSHLARSGEVGTAGMEGVEHGHDDLTVHSDADVTGDGSRLGSSRGALRGSVPSSSADPLNRSCLQFDGATAATQHGRDASEGDSVRVSMNDNTFNEPPQNEQSPPDATEPACRASSAPMIRVGGRREEEEREVEAPGCGRVDPIVTKCGGAGLTEGGTVAHLFGLERRGVPVSPGWARYIVAVILICFASIPVMMLFRFHSDGSSSSRQRPAISHPKSGERGRNKAIIRLTRENRALNETLATITSTFESQISFLRDDLLDTRQTMELEFRKCKSELAASDAENHWYLELVKEQDMAQRECQESLKVLQQESLAKSESMEVMKQLASQHQHREVEKVEKLKSALAHSNETNAILRAELEAHKKNMVATKYQRMDDRIGKRGIQGDNRNPSGHRKLGASVEEHPQEGPESELKASAHRAELDEWHRFGRTIEYALVFVLVLLGCCWFRDVCRGIVILLSHCLAHCLQPKRRPRKVRSACKP